MVIDTTAIIYVLFFIGTLLLVEGLYFLIRDIKHGPEKIVNERLRLAAGNTDSRDVLRKMRREDQGSLSQWINGIAPSLNRLISQSGVQVSTFRLIILMLGSSAVLLALLRLVSSVVLWQSVLMSLVAGIGVPLLVIYLMRQKRLKRFAEQFPDALDVITKSLRAGHPISASFNLVAEEMPDPIGSEFGIVTDEMTYGFDMGEALANLSVRVPQDDLKFFIVAVGVQRTTGGNLAEVLGNLSQVVRDRFRMFAKIRAISAEGRWSGIIISIIPFALIAWLNFVTPSFFGDVKDDPVFIPAMTVAGVLLVIGLITIYRMVNFRV